MTKHNILISIESAPTELVKQAVRTLVESIQAQGGKVESAVVHHSSYMPISKVIQEQP